MSNKAVFLDRDGTINKFVNYLHRIEDFELLAGVGRAIRLINESEYLCIVISNQPMVAMGMLSEEELDRIHCKMRSLLKLEGAYLDDIFYCPHADKPGLIVLPEYNIDCECKKPLPGLFYRASEKYDIDLSKSYMVGDRIRDMEAAVNAGCVPIYVGCEEYKEGKRYNNLLAFAEEYFK